MFDDVRNEKKARWVVADVNRGGWQGKPLSVLKKTSEKGRFRTVVKMSARSILKREATMCGELVLMMRSRQNA